MKKNTLYRAIAAASFVATAMASLPARAADQAPLNPNAATTQARQLNVAGVDHVGINVPDVDAASAFFADLLGARVVSDMRPGKIPDAWKDSFNWRHTSEIDRIVMMQLRDGSKIELFQYSGPDVSRALPHEEDAAETHIALKTVDLDHSLAVLKARGLRILNDPVTLPDGERWFYFLTPWGSQLELVFAPHSV
ncbi:catechol 2,3-dioxygenase-like lactoylglutathione lyase family enzyme [Paraburkholderia sp. GAS199]|uniref:VOC family protein n=1 Tax=Paraburkholderia sp. GAS199 TaxID=3035126 RepID=UPI003D2001A2